MELFLGALGARQVVWGQITHDSIAGTVIYDPNDPEERQDFIWHMDEKEAPYEDVTTLLKHIKENGLLNGDKLAVPIAEIEVANMDEGTKGKAFDKLFAVSVNMVDEGEETDRYFIHE
ncbi:hypothetical protein [Pontibacter akesuensis]|uniref:Uncharacterized protein n=1 Tax=Pontibacter akesuensis TaxID=388950 RepID=A0A1I7FG33_9BACT|nr:hypothetical protein [Pontibacter akesuensis]GHA62328.1 hypothetical protein GCM10007389_13810 [Pontibacter akesuensis]SFU35137.1 hypothetical protein SAMN04487941_0175 [Pontibacter akesuensis]